MVQYTTLYLEEAGKMLRPQQIKLDKIIKGIIKGSKIDEIFLYWVPGAGKSLVAPIVSQMIDDNKTKILWVVPRSSLQRQGEGDFRSSGHFDVGDKDIRMADSAGDPFRGLCGAVTTYQSISANPKKWINVSLKYNLILILDEYDSLTDFSSWVIPVGEMYKNSILRIPMTGTMDRSDSIKISFVPYKNKTVDFSETESRKWIIYDNKKAVEDRSILEFESILVPGSGSYKDKKGNLNHFSEFNGDSNQLKCAFNTDYAYSLFTLALTHWEEHKTYYPWSKILIVAPDINIAKIYLNWFKSRNCFPGIATSEDSDGAAETIRRFKMDNSVKGSLDCLISVAMIYKGLNVPECTHEVFTTIIRGSAWVEQALGRIRRVYKNKEIGYFFCPDDPKIRDVIKKINGGVLYVADGTYKKPSKNDSKNSTDNDTEYLESKAHIDLIPYSMKEKIFREEINAMINKYVGEQSVKELDGKKRVIHTESFRRRNILWMKIYVAIGRKCQLKEMNMSEMETAAKLIRKLTIV